MNRLQKAVLSLLGVKGDFLSTPNQVGMSYALTDPALGQTMARLGGMATHTGKPVNEETAGTVSVWFACLRVLSETMGATVPGGGVYERQKNGDLVKVEHPVGDIIFHSPNSYMTPVENMEADTYNLAQQGNSLSFTDRRGNGELMNVQPIPSNQWIFGFKDGEPVYDVMENGKWHPLPADKVWHIKGFGGNGFLGVSPLVKARQALAISLATEEFQAKFFANGASPSLIVTVPAWLDEKQRIIARENLEKLWGGLDNAHKARLLEGGMTAAEGTMKLQEAQFQELRGFTIPEICRYMRVQPHLVMDLSQSTNNNIEHQGLEFLSMTMMPYTTRISASMTKNLFKPEERKRFVVRFDLDAILRVDSAARAELDSKHADHGIRSRNEIRVSNGFNRVDGNPMMDRYTVQSNMAPIDMLPELAKAQATKPANVAPKSVELIVNNSMPASESKTNVVNLLQEREHNIKVLPAEVTVHGPEVNVQQKSDQSMADAVLALGELLIEIRKGQQEDIDVRKKILDHVEKGITS